MHFEVGHDRGSADRLVSPRVFALRGPSRRSSLTRSSRAWPGRRIRAGARVPATIGTVCEVLALVLGIGGWRQGFPARSPRSALAHSSALRFSHSSHSCFVEGTELTSVSPTPPGASVGGSTLAAGLSLVPRAFACPSHEANRRISRWPRSCSVSLGDPPEPGEASNHLPPGEGTPQGRMRAARTPSETAATCLGPGRQQLLERPPFEGSKHRPRAYGVNVIPVRIREIIPALFLTALSETFSFSVTQGEGCECGQSELLRICESLNYEHGTGGQTRLARLLKWSDRKVHCSSLASLFISNELAIRHVTDARIGTTIQ